MRLWGGQIFSQISLNILNFVLAVSIYDATKTNQSVAFLVISFGLAAFLFGAPAGVWADHLDKRYTLFYSTIVRFALTFFLIFITGNIWATIALSFVLNSVSQLFFPTEAASIPILVKDENLLTANSLFTMSLYTSQLIGYVTAGIILQKLGFNNTIYVLSAMFLIASVFVLGIKFPKSTREKLDIKEINEQIFSRFKDGLKFIKKSRKVQKALLYLGLSQVMVGMFVTLLPGYAVEILHLKVEDTSLYLIAPVAVGMAVGAIMLGSNGKGKNRRKIIAAGAYGAGIALFLLSFDKWLFESLTALAVLFMFFAGLFNSFIVIINNTQLQRRTSEEYMGRIYGVQQVAVTMSAVLPVLLAGYFADIIGVNKVIFFVGVIIILSHLVIRYLYRND